MLQFLRTYQKSFFVVISVVVIASFSFFGVQSTLSQEQTAPQDRTLGTAIDGSKMRLSEIEQLKRFLRTDMHDAHLYELREMPNIFNDGVLRSELIEAGLVEPLFAVFDEELREDFAAVVASHKRYTPYTHKHIPFISSRTIWSYVAPEIPEKLEAFQKEDDNNTLSLVRLLTELYNAEQAIPPVMHKQFLRMQEQQYGKAAADATLENRQVGLFRCKTIEDWFGSRFLDVSAQVVYNGARLAQQKGYVVSPQEVRASIAANAQRALQSQGMEKIDAKQRTALMHNTLASLHMNEKELTRAVETILLFRKYLNTVGKSAFVDTLTHENFHQFASHTVDKELYRFAGGLQLSSFEDMLKLERYLELCALPQVRKAGHILDLPCVFLSAASVEKKAPALVQKRYRVTLQCAKERDALVAIPSQDVWAKQLSAEHFTALQKQFPQLGNAALESLDQRVDAIEALSDNVREQLDTFTKRVILEENPQLLDRLLEKKAPEEKELVLSLDSTKTPLDGINDVRAFRQALDDQRDLTKYTQDGSHFYTIAVQEVGDLELLTFHEALESGALDRLLRTFLEKKYAELRTHSQLVDEANRPKPLDAVYDALGELVYSDVCAAIRQHAGDSKMPREQLAHNRLVHYLEGVQRALEKNADNSEFLHSASDTNRRIEPQEQWLLMREQCTSKRSQKDSWFDLRAFDLPENAWASPMTNDRGAPFFYRVLRHGVDKQAEMQHKKQSRKLLAKEAKGEVFKKLVRSVKDGEAVHL